MQKLKKYFVSSIIFLYLISTFTQTSIFWLAPKEVYAQSWWSHSNIAAVLVDTTIYDSISWDLSWYANTYLPKQQPWTELVVLPLDPSGFNADDVYRILENLYFDWKKDWGSTLVWVIIFWEIPLPSIEVDWKPFLSLHPYTDFEGPPMFTFNEWRWLRLPNWSSHSQPEIRHSIIPTNNVAVFTKFFQKLKKYHNDPTEYATWQIWYDDYELMQKSFSNEQLDEYINTLLFAEDVSYRRINSSLTDVLNSEYAEDLLWTLEVMEEKYAESVAQWVPDELTHPKVDGVRTRIDTWVSTIKNLLFPKDWEVKEILSNSEDSPIAASKNPVPTLINAKQNENNFRELFSVYWDEYFSTLEDNLSAAWRYGMKTVDNTLEFIQLKDLVAMSYLKDINTILEHALDDKIQQEQYMLKEALPTWYEKRKSDDILTCSPDWWSEIDLDLPWFWVNPVWSKFLNERYENFYFWKYAWDVQQYDDLHVYRGDWSNLDATTLINSPIAVRSLEDIPFEWNKTTIWASFWWFAQQTRSMRWTNFDKWWKELELYNTFECEDDPREWSKYFRWWSSQFNIDPEKLEANAKDINFDPEFYDRTYMRHPTVNRAIWWPQYDPAGATLMMENEFWEPTISAWNNFFDWFSVQSIWENLEVNNATIPDCVPLEQDDDIDNDGLANDAEEELDIDGDWILDTNDGDIDGDCIPNTQDDDIDGDWEKNWRDSDCNGGGWNCGQDNDDDSDGIPDDLDTDDDNDWTPDDQEPDQDGDGIIDSEDPDDDNDWLEDEVDPDDDNDGILDEDELDSDGDWIPDDDDPDDDNDGIPDNLDTENNVVVPMITADTLHLTAAKDFSEVVKVDWLSRFDYTRVLKPLLPQFVRAKREKMYCENRKEKDDYPWLSPYEEIDFFQVWENELVEQDTKKVISVSQNPIEGWGWVDRFRKSDVATIEIDDAWMMKENWRPRFYEQNIPSWTEFLKDSDVDRIPDIFDYDLDGDSIENEEDIDIDNDSILNVNDPDIDGDWFLNWLDKDVDGDLVDDEFDWDADGDWVISDDRNDEFSDSDENDTEQGDEDKEWSKCGGWWSCGRWSKQESSDEEVDPISDEEESIPELEDPFDYEVQNLAKQIETLEENFTKEYLVIELSDSDCQYCIDQADKINNDLGLQSQLTNTCDFLVLTPNWNLRDWVTEVWAQTTFVWWKSREITEWNIRDLETIFEDWRSAAGMPHTFIVDQEWKVVSRAMGSLPPDLDSYCPVDKKSAQTNSSILWLLSNPVYAQDEDPDEEECVPLEQDDDIDDDGIPNQEDYDDIDGDGIPNDQDGDIDGDCIPNTSDEDIDGDGKENGKDSDCNGNGKWCWSDNDDDSDGIPDDQDSDDDNDGTPDNEEGDNDNDWKIDSDDEDDDNDNIPDQEDDTPFGENWWDDSWNESWNDDSTWWGGESWENSGSENGKDDQQESGDEQGNTSSNNETFIPGLPYNVEVRENTCDALAWWLWTYREWKYRDYHIIDTVVQHKAPTNTMLHQSNVLTMARPIDDPRYTTFHGVGWDLVKLVYADLYNIPVYDDWWMLLEEKAIEKNVRTYFTQKTQQFNKQLQDQLQKAPWHYAKHASAYDFLATVHSSATPNRSYSLLPSWFLEDLVWEEQIQRIAHSLYYLAYPWEQRPWGSTVDEFLKNARKEFNLDRKIEYVSELYLLLKPWLPEKEADDPVILPRYIDPNLNRKERKAYEIWYINSDGKDGMPISNDTYTTYTIPDAWWSQAPISSLIPDVWSFNEARTNAESIASAEDEECNVPDSWTVPLLKRPKAFKCRLKQTWEKPIEFDINVGVEVQNNFLERMIIDWLWSEPSDTTSWMLGKEYLYSFEKPQPLFWEVFAQEVEDVMEALNFWSFVRLEPSDVFSQNNDVENFLVIWSDRDLWELSVSVSSTWENQIIINWSDISTTSLDLDLLLDWTREKLPIRIQWSNSSPQNILVKICKSSSCVEKSVTSFMSPWSLDQISIITPSSQVPKWWAIPITLLWGDENWNPLPFAPSGTTLVIQWGTLENWLSSREISNITNDVHMIFADKDASSLNMRLENDWAILWQKTLPILDIQANFQNQIVYTLPQKEIWFKNRDWTYTEDRLPKIFISFDWADKNFILPIKVEGAEHLVRHWSIKEDWSFDQSAEAIVQWNEVFLPLLPTWKTWTSELIITLAGLGKQIIPITIKPSWPDELIFDIPSDWVDPWDIIEANVSIFDSRWNPYTDPIEVDLEAEGAREIARDVVVATWWTAAFTWVAKPWGWSCWASWSCWGWWGGNSWSDWSTSWDSWGESWDGDWSDGDGSDGDGNNEWDDSNNEGEEGEEGENEDNKDDSEDKDENDNEDEDQQDDGEDWDGSWWAWWSWRTQWSASFSTNKVLWPDQREPQELNVMYLNLYWSSRWNEARIIDMLRNEKTLAITTTRKLPWASIYADKKTVFDIDGTRNDEMELIKNMTLEGEHVWVNLGYNWWVWRYYMWTTDQLWLSVKSKKEWQKERDDPDVKIKKVSSSCSQSKNQILINKNLIWVDFEFWFIHDDVDIVPAEKTWKTWNIMYQNELIATFELLPKSWASLDIDLSDEVVEVTARTSWSVTVEFKDIGAVDGDVPFYEWISSSFNANDNLWFRHDFNWITNFSQWLAVGPANQRFADPFLVNIWDPFLKRIEASEAVPQTKFDAGIWQQIYASSETMFKVETMDVDWDGKLDLVLWYNDWSLRILKNYGWWEPYSDLWSLTVIADWLKDFWPGDVDWDGDDDILVLTNAEKLRAYKNDDWVLEVDWRPVCLDIPNWEYSSVSQTNQLFVTDVDGNDIQDIVTYAVDWEIEVFYGWGDSYISTDSFECDPWAISRNNKTLLKSMKLTVWADFSDNSLIHWSWLETPSEEPAPPEWYDQAWESLSSDLPDATTEDEFNQIIEDIKQEKIDQVQSIDIDWLIDDGKDKMIDYIMAAPVSLRPHAEKDNEEYAFMRAQDTLETSLAKAKVTKSLSDNNWWYVEKWDILTVTVTIAGWGNIDYLERLDIPVVIYKDEYNRIISMQNWLWWTIDWNIGQWYEFMIQWWSPGSFTYEVMYNWNGHARVEVETEMEEVFEHWVSRTSRLGSPVYAWSAKAIRVYPDDSCYKWYREFDPWEEFVNLQDTYEQKRDVFVNYFEAQRTELEDKTTDSNLDRIKELMWIHEVDFDEPLMEVINDVLKNVPAIWTDVNVRFDVWEVELWWVSLNEMNDVMQSVWNTLCKWIKFGETNCWGLPIPFNMSFLSPGTMNVFGCKLFDDPGLPLVAFPTTIPTWRISNPAPIPFFRPSIFPKWAWWYFDYSIWRKKWEFDVKQKVDPERTYESYFRLYVSPTLTNWVGIAMCFGKYDSINLPDPLWDVVWNCIVMWAPIPGMCDDDGDAYANNKHDWSTTIDDKTRDLQQVGVCDPSLQARSPFYSTATQNPVAMEWKPNTVIASAHWSSENYKESKRSWWWWWWATTTQDLLTLDSEYTLKWWTAFDLEVQWWNVKWVTECIIRKRKDKQIRYVANNMLNMQVTLILPDLKAVGEWFSEIGQMSKEFDLKKWWKKLSFYQWDSESVWTQETHKDSETTVEKLFMPRWILRDLEDNFSNPFDQIANLFENTPFINVKQRRVRMQIPRLFEEDIARFELERKSWVSRNQEILDAWKRWDFEWSQDIEDEMARALGDVKRNLNTINEYKKLPSVLYDYIHSRDKYVLEVYDFSEDIVKQLTWWLQVNANRYSAYVDAIILMIWIIETWQPVIDFSINWKTKCGKCRVDNYDYYSCKLSLLCVDLPVFPIPPFKIPDIYIDLSQIRLGIDILLPKFVFLPEKIYFPVLPDLPDPRNFELEIDVEIPDIPQLSLPPPLPQLPDITLEANIELPNLPPAPEIPDLIPSVKKVIDIADIIGTFFCIFKWWIWLVTEQWVKSRIEQLTQRTWSVSPFDSISITLPDAPVEWYDYHIDAFVDLKVSFDELYNVFDEIADTVNEWVSKKVDKLKELNRKATNTLINPWGIWEFLNWWKVELDLDLWDLDKWDLWLNSGPSLPIFSRSSLTQQQKDYHNVEHKWWSLQDSKEKLIEQFSYILSNEEFELYHDDILSLHSFIDSDAQVSPNYTSLNAAHQGFKDMLSKTRGSINEMKNLITQDYDQFVKTYVQDHILLNADEQDVFVDQFDVQLFTWNQKVISTITQQIHPTESYINLHKPLIEGYQNALEENSAVDLQMTELVYDSSKRYIDWLADRFIWDEKWMILAQTSWNRNDELVDEEECVPLLQDDDIDNDWIPNQQDIVDIDGDWIPNDQDGDIDWDCIPNTTDEDIDWDGKENWKDSDCNWNGKWCGSDNDDDSDWIPDDQDNDNDNDGTPDDQEWDNDNDWIDDSEDEDDDNDWIPDQEDDTPFGEDDVGDEWDESWDELWWWAWAWAIENFAEKTGFEQIDFSQYIDWFFIKWTDDKYHNVVWRWEKIKKIQDAWTYTFVDLNGDWWVDILSRDGTNIYVKYDSQKDAYPWASAWWMTVIWPWSSVEELEEAAKKDNGYISGFKVRDYYRTHISFSREWNNFESLWFARDNDHKDSYLVRLSRNISVQKQKSWSVWSTWSEEIKYLLMVPEWIEYEWVYLEVPDELSKKKIKDHVDSEDIIQVSFYDWSTETLSAILENLDPAGWRYAKVSSLRLEKNSTLFWGSSRLFTPASARSRQVVAWNQKWGDDAQPYLGLELIRNKTWEKFPWSSELGGYVLTDYTLSWQWLDNWKVLENRIEYDNEIIYFDESDKLLLENLYYKEPTKEHFVFWSIDQAWNKTTMEVELNIIAPEVNITNIKDKGSWYDIETEMSATIDDWKIAFLRDRYWWREEMNPFTFPVKPTDPKVTGWIYITDDEIALKDSDWNTKCNCNAKNWKISIPATTWPNENGGWGVSTLNSWDWWSQKWVANNVEVLVDFLQQSPEVAVIDNDTEQTIFRIWFTSQELVSLGILDWNYESRVLEDNSLWLSYIWWTCIGPIDWECHMYVSPDGNLIIPEPYNSEYMAEYWYDDEEEAVIYYIKDALWKPIVELRFIIVPLI